MNSIVFANRVRILHNEYQSTWLSYSKGIIGALIKCLLNLAKTPLKVLLETCPSPKITKGHVKIAVYLAQYFQFFSLLEVTDSKLFLKY